MNSYYFNSTARTDLFTVIFSGRFLAKVSFSWWWFLFTSNTCARCYTQICHVVARARTRLLKHSVRSKKVIFSIHQRHTHNGITRAKNHHTRVGDHSFSQLAGCWRQVLSLHLNRGENSPTYQFGEIPLNPTSRCKLEYCTPAFNRDMVTSKNGMETASEGATATS